MTSGIIINTVPGAWGNGLISDEDYERRQLAMSLRVRRRTYSQIAEELGYPSAQAARSVIMRGLRQRSIERNADADALLTHELEELDALAMVAWRILEREHVAYSNGRLITIDGEFVADDAPAMQAIQTILRIQERRARLTGIDAPIKSRVEVRNVDALDDEFERLLGQLAGRSEAGQAPGDAARGRPTAIPDPA